MGERTSPSRDLFEAMEAAVPYIAIGMHEEMKRMAESVPGIAFTMRLLKWLSDDPDIKNYQGYTVGLCIDHRDHGGDVDFWFPSDYEIDELVRAFVRYENGEPSGSIDRESPTYS